MIRAAHICSRTIHQHTLQKIQCGCCALLITEESTQDNDHHVCHICVCETLNRKYIQKTQLFLGLSDIYNQGYHVTIPSSGMKCASMLKTTFSNCCFLYVYQGPNTLLNFLFV